MKFLFSAAILVAPPLAAQTAAPTDQTKIEAGSTTKPVEERKLCRKDARTSTRLVKRTCRTAAEWREIDARTDGADNIVRNPD